MSAVILLSHGSPDARFGQAARELAAGLTARASGRVVKVAFLEHETPTLTDTALALAGAGQTRALVVPILLGNAYHLQVDVPAAMVQARSASGMQLELTEHLGPDQMLLPALDRNLPPGPIVLASAGTSNIDAQLALAELAATWAAQRKTPVSIAYASLALPSVASAVTDLESATGARAAVAAFVLFPGILPDRIIAAAQGRTVSPPLSNALETANLIELRIRTALRRAARC